MSTSKKGDDALSRMLARILRRARYHAQGPVLQAADGYVSLRQILLVEALFKDYSEEEVVQVAKNSSSTKGNRFMIREARAGEEGPYIRAAYTHNRHLSQHQGKGCGKAGSKREQANGKKGQAESFGKGNARGNRGNARGNARGNSDVIMVWQPVNRTERVLSDTLSSDSPVTSCPESTLSPFVTESANVWMQSAGDDPAGGRLAAGSVISSIDNYTLSEGSEADECYEIEWEFDTAWRLVDASSMPITSPKI